MKNFPLTPIFAAVITAFLMLSSLNADPVHPRLLFGPEEVPALRAKAQNAPYDRILESIEWVRSHDPFFTADGQDQFHKDFGNPAILYLFTGDTAWSDLARDETLYYLSRTEWWANTSYSSLRRGALSRGASLSYDFCYDAWAGQTVPASVTYRGQTRTVPAQYVGRPLNEVVSEAILANAQSLIASGGSGWPGGDKYGNNWYAVRYAGAGIGFLATDHAINEAQLTSAVNEVTKYIETTLTKRADAQGWNPEGHGYAMYPGQFTYLFELVLNRLRSQSLGTATPSFDKQLWSIFQGGLPLPTKNYPNNSGEMVIGLHPDFTDDNLQWIPEGTANLAFAHSPTEFLPGLKWIYRRVFGELGDNRWDTSSIGGLFAMLYYPDDVAEQNPAEIPGWGLNYYDPAFGMTMMRNRYDNTEDTVVMFNGKFRSAEGGHNGPDGMAVRLVGEGHVWLTGSGRTTNPRGQTTVFTGDPSGPAGDSSVYSERFGTEQEIYLRDGGGGIVAFNAFRSDAGVRGHTRRVLTDYDSHVTGATALVLIEDSTVDGQYWRLNTPGSNTIELRSDGFIIRSIDGVSGPTLVGKVLHGDASTLRTGTFTRGSQNFDFRGVNYPENKWVDFRSDDGYFLVALMLLPAGADEPALAWSATLDNTVVVESAGLPPRTYAITEAAIAVSGWERPVVAITSPVEGQEFTGSAANFILTGTASDIDGVVERVEVFIDGVYQGLADYNAGTGIWTHPVSLSGIADYALRVRAIDNALEYQDSDTITIRVTQSLPPRLMVTHPAINSVVPAGQQVQLAGTVYDEDGVITTVTVFNNGTSIGNATVDSAKGTWSYNWTSLPFGRNNVTVRATDNSGDVTWTPSLRILGSLKFSDVPYAGDAANWSLGHGTNRWTVASDGQAMRYYLGTGGTSDSRQSQNMLRDQSMDGDFRLEFMFKTEIPLSEQPQYQIFFGQGVWVRMTTRGATASSAFNANGSDNGATQIQRAESQHQRWIAYAYGAGISSEDWQHVVAERTGNDMRITVDGIEILNTQGPTVVNVTTNATYQPGKTYVWTARKDSIGLSGLVGVGNFFGTYTQRGWFDDIVLTRLNAPTKPEITLDSPQSPLVAQVGQPISFSGTFSHPDNRPTTIELYAGSHLIGAIETSANVWSYQWTPTLSADYALRIRAVDNRLEEMWTEPLFVRVTSTGGETLTGPQVTVLQPIAPMTVPIGAAAVLEVSGTQGSVPLSHVSIFEGTTRVMDARKVGSQTRWVADLPTGLLGTRNYTARLFDASGAHVDAAIVTASVIERTADLPVRINFQLSSMPLSTGYYQDNALASAARGFGLSYGWEGVATAHERNALTASDRRYATGVVGSNWQVALAPGFYEVRIVSGNPAATGSFISGLFVQGAVVYTGLPQTAGQFREDVLSAVEVSEGLLTISANPAGVSGQNVGLYFIDITPLSGGNLRPLVSWTQPSADEVFGVGESVPLVVEARDIDGTINSVNFFADGLAIGSGVRQGTTDLWSLNWTPSASLEGFVLLTAEAIDAEGASRITDPARRIIIGEVTNQPPVALFTSNPTFGDAPLLVAFNASASYDPDGSIASYAWDFNNGNTSTNSSVSQTFHTPGVYAVVLTVTDNAGATGQRTAYITVTDPSVGGQAITILEQPQGGEVNAGVEWNMTIEAIGQGPLSFDWYEGPVDDIANSVLVYSDGSTSTAAALAYDPIEFGEAPGDYVAGTALSGKAPVISGWSGAWSGGSSNRPLTIFGTLEYTDVMGNELVVSGGRIRQSTTSSNNPTRNFATAVGGPLSEIVVGGKIASGTVYYSHLMRWERTSAFSFGLRDGTTQAARLYCDLADGNTWKVQVGGQVLGVPVPFPSHTVHLIVWSIDFETGTTRFYLNPSLGSEPTTATLEFNQAVPFNNVHFSGNREYDMDELRLGTSYAAVTPHLTPAQPQVSTWTTPPLSTATSYWVKVSNPVVSVTSAAAGVTVATADPYVTWAAALPLGGRDELADPYNFGMPNRVRFALGLSPNAQPSSVHYPVPTPMGDGWRMEWPLRSAVPFTVEGSFDLIDWYDLQDLVPTSSIIQSAPADGMTTLTVTVPGNQVLFIRLGL